MSLLLAFFLGWFFWQLAHLFVYKLPRRTNLCKILDSGVDVVCPNGSGPVTILLLNKLDGEVVNIDDLALPFYLGKIAGLSLFKYHLSGIMIWRWGKAHRQIEDLYKQAQAYVNSNPDSFKSIRFHFVHRDKD